MGDGVFLVLGLALSVVVFCAALYNAVKNILTKFDSSRWEDEAQPDIKAEIISVESEKVQYVKNGAKFKTTVIFEDGFKFVTHKTDREQRFGSYTISVNRAEICRRAVQAHEKAVLKRQKKAESMKG